MDSDILFSDSPFARFSRRTFLGILLTAVVAGIITLLLTLAIDKVVLQPALCTASDAASCTQSSLISFHIASVIAAIVAIVMLVQASVYRPLLVAIAVTLALWNLYSSFLASAPWPLQLLTLVVLNILAYFSFAWLLRTYNLIIALVSSFALVVLVLLVTSL